MGDPAEVIQLSVDQYLEGEKLTDVRHEYVSGFVYAMGGASARHNRISLNIAGFLNGKLTDHPCEPFMADMKVRLKVGVEDAFFYPDVMVCCDPDDGDDYFRTNPCLIIEVLSPTTERTDRREKFFAYTRIESLREYLLVDQERREVTLRRRDTEWAKEILTGDGEIQLRCADLTLPLDTIYARSGVSLDGDD